MLSTKEIRVRIADGASIPPDIQLSPRKAFVFDTRQRSSWSGIGVTGSAPAIAGLPSAVRDLCPGGTIFPASDEGKVTPAFARRMVERQIPSGVVRESGKPLAQALPIASIAGRSPLGRMGVAVEREGAASSASTRLQGAASSASMGIGRLPAAFGAAIALRDGDSGSLARRVPMQIVAAMGGGHSAAGIPAVAAAGTKVPTDLSRMIGGQFQISGGDASRNLAGEHGPVVGQGQAARQDKSNGSTGISGLATSPMIGVRGDSAQSAVLATDGGRIQGGFPTLKRPAIGMAAAVDAAMEREAVGVQPTAVLPGADMRLPGSRPEAGRGFAPSEVRGGAAVPGGIRDGKESAAAIGSGGMRGVAARIPDMLYPTLAALQRTQKAPMGVSGGVMGMATGRIASGGGGVAPAASMSSREPDAPANEVHHLANEVWSLLKRRLATESERQGRW